MTTNATRLAGKGKRPAFARWFRIAFGYGLGGACLLWVFRDLPVRQLLQSLAGINGWWLVSCVALILAAYFCVAWEWQMLLRPVGRLAFRRAAQAVFAGRFANDVLPMQFGYLVRAALASRWMRVSLAATLPSLIVERLWDGVWLAGAIGFVSFFVALPPDVIQARNVLGTTVLAGTVAVIVTAFFRGRFVAGPLMSKPASGGLIGRITVFVSCLSDGLRGIIGSRLLPAVLGLSLLKLAAQAAAFLAALQAFGFQLSFGAELAVFLVGYLGMCVPSTPAGTGLFQLFVVAGLDCFGIEKPAAVAFSLVSFALLTLPPAVAGFFALARSGMTLRQFRSETREFE